MNRRDLIKTAIVVPILGLFQPAKAKVKARSPNWDAVVTDQGFGSLVKSVCTVLELFFNKDRIRASHPASVKWYWDCARNRQPNYYIIFDIDGCGGFGINLIEYKKNDRKQLLSLLKTRWIDWLWGMNDTINVRVELIRRFDPNYNPDENRE